MQRQLSVAFTGINSETPLNTALSAQYTKSFAYHTVKDRLPVTLTTVVDQLVRHKEEITNTNEVSEIDLKNCIGKISKLKNEVQTNKTFVELSSNGSDVEDWNKELARQREESGSVCWYESPWLYVECYMYRRLVEIFECSDTLKDFDFFSYQKREAFRRSVKDLKQLATFTDKAVSTSNEVLDKDCFISLLKSSLWGNRCDLSISDGSQVEVGQHGLNFVRMLDPYLLHDDSEEVYNLVSSANSEFIIDFIADNAAYELFSDLCLCDYLCANSSSRKIRFHLKKMPWYVSDATPKDFKWILEQLKEMGLDQMAQRWESYLESSVWTVLVEDFWTTPFPYVEMSDRDFALYSLLSKSNLIIFKGDLNYRKLVQDVNWDFSADFGEVLGEFKPSCVLTLRTIKSDLVCGLKPEKFVNLLSDLSWMRTGEYATIQLFEKS